jgi:signal transduction histidine kinase
MNKPGRILIVDDEVPVMTALRNTLEDEGYQAEGVSSGTKALQILKEGGVDLMLTDLMMPKMDGITLVGRALAIDPFLGAIVMTGHGTISTAVGAMKEGAFDYITKPFKLNAILPVLERALGVRRLKIQNAELEKRIRDRSAELEAANKELEAFSFSVSHDLRTPLRAISGMADLLMTSKSDPLPPEVRRRIEMIHKGTREMDKLIDDLLAFSRSGSHPVARVPVDLEEMVRTVFSELVTDHGAEIIVRPLPPVEADEAMLRQVVVNLLSNALKFSRGTDQPRIEVGVDGTSAESFPIFYVRDNGVGFDMDDSHKLFGVFQRLHHSREFEGTGVGLATVRRIVERHGGRIWAAAAPGQGATFYFTLRSAA